MMGTDKIEERILIPAAKMTSDHWTLLRSLLNPVMLQDWSMITFARCCFEKNRRANLNMLP